MVKHYLMTLDVGQDRMHSYVMCEKQHDLELVASRMLHEVEKAGIKHFMPIMLSTTLDTGVEIVREILIKNYPEAQKQFETATNFHCTIWAMPAGCPDDLRLMELH